MIQYIHLFTSKPVWIGNVSGEPFWLSYLHFSLDAAFLRVGLLLGVVVVTLPRA